MTVPAITLRELVADWLHGHYSHSYQYVWAEPGRLERELSERSKNRWRRDADALLELIAAARATP